MSALKNLGVALVVAVIFLGIGLIAGIEECRKKRALGAHYEGPLDGEDV